MLNPQKKAQAYEVGSRELANFADIVGTVSRQRSMDLEPKAIPKDWTRALEREFEQPRTFDDLQLTQAPAVTAAYSSVIKRFLSLFRGKFRDGGKVGG